MSRLPATAALVVALAINMASATASVAEELPAPELWAADAPVTRTQTVDIAVLRPFGETVAGYTLANARVVDTEGRLVGVSFPGRGPWTLADGPSGPRTVYAQARSTSGTYSPIGALDFRLLLDPASALYADFDPGVTSVPRTDWHTLSRSSSTGFSAYTMPVDGSRPTAVAVHDATWHVSFHDSTGDFAPGVYQVGDAASASVGTSPTHTSCYASGGSFTINNVVLAADGSDVEVIDIDFRLQCSSGRVAAGSVRYGSSRAITGLDQSVDSMLFGSGLIGARSATKTVTITNFGDTPAQLGAALLSGDGAGDYELASDTCTRRTLDLLDSCAIGVAFVPRTRGHHPAILTIGDPTARQQRRVSLSGAGVQSTQLSLSATRLVEWPASSTFVVVLEPPPSGEAGAPTLEIDGSQLFGPTVRQLSNPPRTEYSYSRALEPGSHTAVARYGGGDFYAPADTQTLSFTIEGGAPSDTTPPTGEIVVESVGPYTNDPNVRISFPAQDAGSGVTHFQYTTSNWGMTNWLTLEYNAETVTQDWRLDLDGPYVVRARWRDNAGNWSDSVDASIVLDTVAPAVDNPAVQLTPNGVISNGNVPVQVSWAAVDPASGLSSFAVGQRVGSGSWSTIAVGGLNGAASTQQSHPRLVAPGKNHSFRARARDRAGTVSAWATVGGVLARAYQEGRADIRYSGSWRWVRNSGFWYGNARYSTAPGATASLTFVGRAVGWVARVGPDRGKAEVSVDGQAQTIDLWAAQPGWQRIVWSRAWASPGTHTVTIKVLSTPGRPRVDLDALVLFE